MGVSINVVDDGYGPTGRYKDLHTMLFHLLNSLNRRAWNLMGSERNKCPVDIKKMLLFIAISFLLDYKFSYFSHLSVCLYKKQRCQKENT